MKIYHFYHIWADGVWEEAFEEHLKALQYSRLFEVLSGFYVGIVGNKDNREKTILYLKDKGIDFINLKDRGIDFAIVNQSDTGFEEVTLNKILDIKEDDGYILYSHTKSSFNNNEQNQIWRKNMTKFLILEWIGCVDLLKYYAAVGCSYHVFNNVENDLKNAFEAHDLSITKNFMHSSQTIIDRKGIFVGNFWWSHLRYLKALPKLDSDDRFRSEFWLYDLKNVVNDKKFEVFSKMPSFDRSRYA